MQQAPVVKDLVLIGGGHSHVAVLRAFGMKPLPGLRLTLVSRGSDTPYSGMLPGLIAGHYTADEAHIDLVPLCRFAGARFIEDEACGVDLERQRVSFASRAPLGYDILSINSGSTPSVGGIDQSEEDLIGVKPIDRFLGRWRRLQQRIESEPGPLRIGIVGGGAGGVELILSIEHRLRARRRELSFCLLTDGPEILVTHGAGVRRRFERILAEKAVGLRTNARVVERSSCGVVLDSGESIELDEVLFVTHAAPADWIAGSGLAVDEHGFLLVDEHLRSVSHANVFGAGDVAAMRDSPRPKSGVFAVRQGKPLARNLRRAALRQPLVSYHPQRHFLSLIGTGEKRAVASRGAWSAEGAWIWAWKEHIDRKFMRRYQELPPMSAPSHPVVPEVLRRELPSDAYDDGMRCGGCGAKVGARALAAALGELDIGRRDDVLVGLEHPDDAAVVAVPAGKHCVLSVDAFRPIVDDPYVFGRIVANHCLNDLFAVGAEPQTALAIATLPVWPEEKLAEELRQMLSGVTRALREENALLVGGHTSEGAELSLGLSVSGLIASDAVLRKQGLQAGDKLILTKPLGTGTIFAADMRARAKGRWVDAAIESMLQSNRAASECLRRHGATAVTDVTGFGLAGHLSEMLSGTPLGVTLHGDALPALAGARECIHRAWLSTLHDRNRAAASDITVDGRVPAETYELLHDPQTAGGLLAGVAAARADACIAELGRLGYTEAAVIGVVEDAAQGRIAVV